MGAQRTEIGRHRCGITGLVVAKFPALNANDECNAISEITESMFHEFSVKDE